MILVTGGLGFIGLHAARGLLDLGEKVVLTQYQVPRMPDFIKDEVDKRAFIEQLDVTDGDRVLEICRKHAVDGIVHMVSPDSDLGSAGYYRIVMTGLLNVLEAGRICGVKRLTVASSQTTYTGVKEGPFREDMPLRTTANNQGEAFKKSMEVLSHYYGQREELDVVAMRIGAIYGPLYTRWATWSAAWSTPPSRGRRSRLGAGSARAHGMFTRAMAATCTPRTAAAASLCCRPPPGWSTTATTSAPAGRPRTPRFSPRSRVSSRGSGWI